MRSDTVRILIFVVVAMAFVLPLQAAGSEKQEIFVRDEVLVKISPDARASAVRSFAALAAEIVEELRGTDWLRVRLHGGKEVEAAIAEFRTLDGVLHVQPNFFYRLQVVPNDPQWGTVGMWGLPMISAPAAWDITTGSPNVVVANIDTGMRLTHEDLAANIWTNSGEIPNNGVDDDGNGFIDDVHGWDFRYNDSDPTDEHGHGTHVGGTIGAVGNNALGVVGVNWNVRLMAIKIFSQAANDTTSAMLINAYNYVRLMKERGVNIRVANNSYGGCPEACEYDRATKEAIDALGDAGVLSVFAAGNNNRNVDEIPFYPGSYDSPSILNVASSVSSDNRSSFSNYGAVSVDLAAPGSGILSTTNGSNSSYGGSSGTSMAAPHVAGAAALLSAYRPELSAASLKATLMNTVDQPAQWNGLVRSNGRLNVLNALNNPTVCDPIPSQKVINVPTKGGHFTFNVSAAANCDYTIKKNVNWVNLVSGNVASGNAIITIRVGMNNTISRQTILTIVGRQVEIRQSRGQKF